MCVVQQTDSTLDFNLEEVVTIEWYGRLQMILCALMVPASIFYMIRHVQSLNELEEKKNDTNAAIITDSAIFANPLEDSKVTE